MYLSAIYVGCFLGNEWQLLDGMLAILKWSAGKLLSAAWRFWVEYTICVDAHFTENITVNCNAANLRLIIDNLLKNAVSHAKSNVIVNVNKVAAFVEISIEDDGKGIPKQDYETIFIPYARLDNSRTRKTGGLGMGLAIVKSAVNQLDGEISISSSASGGARFKIKLPILH